MANTLEFLNETDRKLLSSRSKKLTFAAGQALIREGDPSWALYVVTEGTARVERNGKAIATMSEGDIFGEMSFLESGNASATVTAQDDLSVELIESRELLQTFESFPHLGARFYRSIAVTLSRRLRETSRLLAEATSAS